VLYATDWRATGIDPLPIKGGVALSGVFDLEPLVLTSMNPDLRLNAENAAAWSPLRMRPVIEAPLLVAVGADETSEFIRQSQLMWEAWPEVRPASPSAGNDGPLLIPAANHFSAMDRFADPRDQLFADTLRMFD
jgi:arylformamidase